MLSRPSATGVDGLQMDEVLRFLDWAYRHGYELADDRGGLPIGVDVHLVAKWWAEDHA